MADQYKTRCPHCGAQFKITQAHLKQAKGTVRCGSCLQIFQADEHLLDSPAVDKNSPPPILADSDDSPWDFSLDDSTPQRKADSDDKADPLTSWRLGDNNKADNSSAAPVPQDNDTDEDEDDNLQLSNSFLNLDEDDDAFSLDEDFSDMQGAGKASHNSNSDESWAEALLAELEGPDTAAASAPVTPPAAEKTPDRAPESKAPPATQRPATTAPAATSTPRASTPTAAPAAAKKAAPARPASLFDSGQNVDSSEDEDDDSTLFAGLDLFADEPVTAAAPAATPVARETIARSTYYRTANPIPPRDYRPLFQWTGLSLVALLVLAGQYLYFNFDDMARTPQWRPWYTQACELIGCTLPQRSDVSKVRGANLVVRSHPQYQNALVVDAILFNEARYRQPFPVLELSFSTLNGQPVASRQFKPQEYLHGDLQDMTTMPIGMPLHLSLEIVDPGEQAVNYNLRLLPGAE